ncbi:phage holin family protein [Confluentibacter citreus]|uniref:phage holin family protein n=1 Tax=Confluentibacter citreus TaxID=2007307 RepID=UPI000C282B90|nr:phage holin family protein [Confluentibacter citreus]
METTAKHIELLYDKVKEYTETSIELYKLNAIDVTADVVSSLVSRIAVALVFSLFTLFVNIAISLLIGKLLGAYYLGFLIVSGFYLIIALIIYFFNDTLIKAPITNLIISKLLRPRRSEFVKSNTEENEKS